MRSKLQQLCCGSEVSGVGGLYFEVTGRPGAWGVGVSCGSKDLTPPGDKGACDASFHFSGWSLTSSAESGLPQTATLSSSDPAHLLPLFPSGQKSRCVYNNNNKKAKQQQQQKSRCDFGVPGIDPRSASRMASALPAVLCSQPGYSANS